MLEVYVTLKDPAKPPERSVLLNAVQTRGARQRYFIRVTKDVAGANPKDMILTVGR